MDSVILGIGFLLFLFFMLDDGHHGTGGKYA